MSYDPSTDFLGLLRLTAGGVRSERMPGLDYVVAALARAGMFALSVGQTAPVVNQATTVWFQPAQPSWASEGVTWLWNPTVPGYQVATPALWVAFFANINSGYKFQSAAAAVNNVTAGVTLLAVQRNNPVTTSVVLPALGAQVTFGKPLQIVDFSTNVVNHAIVLTTPDGATIMQLALFTLNSTAVQLAGVMLQPSPDLNAWIIAP